MFVSTSLIFAVFLFGFASENVLADDYITNRNKILQEELEQTVGGNIKLTEKERRVNEILLRAKHEELDGVEGNVSRYAPDSHFFQTKNDVDKSKVFAIIQKVPKGASLHTHLLASVSLDYFYKDLLNRENLHGCVIEGRLKLRFFKPGNSDSSCKWDLVQNMKKSVPEFDTWIKTQISLLTPGDPRDVYKDIHAIWKTFVGLFGVAYNVIACAPVFRDYIYQVLKEYQSDNIFYAEFRANYYELYDLDGTIYNYTKFFEVFSEAVDAFKRDNPAFLGAKLIYSPNRYKNNTELEDVLRIFRVTQSAYPNLVAGFDLVGFEDTGTPLLRFYKELENVKNSTDFYFHAGETNWYGFDVDHNLLDAVLLGAKRIGHGYALAKHPKIMEMVKRKDIALEISSISTQVLMYVEDLRNHPAVTLIAHGFPVVICNDDPGFWDAKGLSYDWYMAYMAMVSRGAGIGFFKQLALNSIKYSAMSVSEKERALRQWNASWEKFIDDTIKNKMLYE